MKNLNKAFSETASEIYDNTNGLNYMRVGDYYLPMLTAPKSPKVGDFGKAHSRYLRAEKKMIFDGMMLSGKLNTYLENIDRQADEMFDKLIKNLAEKEGITEKLKAENQMLWVQKMNSIRNRATEIVNAELIYI